MTITHRAAKHGRMTPELSPGLSSPRRFKCHPSKRAVAATAVHGGQYPRVCRSLPPCASPPPDRGWSRARSRAARPAVVVGPAQGGSVVAGLCPRGLGVSPSPPPQAANWGQVRDSLVKGVRSRRGGGSHLIPSRCLENPNCAVFS